MICARCDKPILPGEPSEKRDITRPTGAGVTMHFHRELCKKAPFQTTPRKISR